MNSVPQFTSTYFVVAKVNIIIIYYIIHEHEHPYIHILYIYFMN